MFKKKIDLFKLFGFTVSVDASWLIILFLVVWSLAKGLFPYYYPELPERTYWFMGIIGAIGLFISIIIHEFSHSYVARINGLRISEITLFIFGGVARMKEEPGSAKVEFRMAIAGPIASVALSLLFAGLYLLSNSFGWSTPTTAILGYLSGINMLLAVFNMIPAFPTDGGRILRSILWWKTGDIYLATKIASRVSIAFSFAIVFIGFLDMAGGNFIGGLWWILIGTFLFNAANMSYQNILIERSLKGKTVRDFMNPNPIIVPSDITLREFIEKYVYRYHYKMFPVMDDGRVLGIIAAKNIKTVPRTEWDNRLVREFIQRAGPENSIEPNTDIKTCLSKMERTGLTRLLVMEDGKLVGIVTLKDLLEYMALKMELEE